ncbi:MAG: ATP-binding cassette domain-containing protein, partial [Puniceicoccales bacterium]|nr:ATP-binding cassette domain-containing protein [Puniceicoccales bacterium]
ARPPTFSAIPATAPAIETADLAAAPCAGVAPVLQGISLCVPQGCRAALAGANGSGKSTLLRTLAGLLPPCAGKVFVEGKPASCGNPRVAFLAQRHLVEWHFPVTVSRAVLAGRYPRLGWLRRPNRDDREKAAAALRRLRLEALADRPLHALSGGQQQRVLIARALCQEAAVLLLDEPFAGLDAESREIVSDFLADDPARAMTVVMATHDLDDTGCRFDMVLKITRDGSLAPNA